MNNRIDIDFCLKVRLAFGAGSSKGYSVYKKYISGEIIPKAEKDRIDNITAGQTEKIIEGCKNNGISIVTLRDTSYPDCLRNIAVPPIVLFIKGKMPDFDRLPVITIVGPRKVTDFGKRAAYSLSLRLSKAGFTVVSGAALGADSEALKGALDGSGTPVGVLGCGIMYDYLPENRELRNKTAEAGCLISEYPPFEGASKYSFPVRNRIMSALSQATVVVEAGEKSGALITARHAAEQGKDVLVIPGNPTFEQYKGSNSLLRDGAIPLLDASDVFNLYLPVFPEQIDVEKAFTNDKPKKFEKNKNKSVSGLSKNATIMYNTINKKQFIADDMLVSGLSGDEILSSLTELEIMGFIKSLPGGMFEVL